MKIFQSRSFLNKVKKISENHKSILDKEIKKIIKNPEIGEEKKGDLRGVFIHKFKIKTLLYLLAYRFKDENLELIMIGPHENYYKDLKKNLK